MSLPFASICDPCTGRYFIAQVIKIGGSSSAPSSAEPVAAGTEDEEKTIGEFTAKLSTLASVANGRELIPYRSPSVYMEIYRKTTWDQTNFEPGPPGIYGEGGGCYRPYPTPEDLDPPAYDNTFWINADKRLGFMGVVNPGIGGDFSNSQAVIGDGYSAAANCYAGGAFVLEDKSTAIDFVVQKIKDAPYTLATAEFLDANFEPGTDYSSITLSIDRNTEAVSRIGDGFWGIATKSAVISGSQRYRDRWFFPFGVMLMQTPRFANPYQGPVQTGYYFALQKVKLQVVQPVRCRLVLIDAESNVIETRPDLLTPRVYLPGETVEPTFPSAMTYDEEEEIGSLPSCLLEVAPLNDGHCIED